MTVGRCDVEDIDVGARSISDMDLIRQRGAQVKQVRYLAAPEYFGLAPRVFVLCGWCVTARDV
jgi:hypothetical protein